MSYDRPSLRRSAEHARFRVFLARFIRRVRSHGFALVGPDKAAVPLVLTPDQRAILKRMGQLGPRPLTTNTSGPFSTIVLLYSKAIIDAFNGSGDTGEMCMNNIKQLHGEIGVLTKALHQTLGDDLLKTMIEGCTNEPKGLSDLDDTTLKAVGLFAAYGILTTLLNSPAAGRDAAQNN